MLTEVKIRSLKPAEKVKRYYDAQGLYLEVTTAGNKYWRYKYRFDGREKRISLGVYPAVTLKLVRRKRQHAQDYLEKGLDPSSFFKRGRLGTTSEAGKGGHTFQAVAETWLEAKKETWSEGHYDLTKSRLEKNIFPFIGSTAISEIKPIDVLAPLRAIEARGARDVAHKCYGMCSMIFRYAVASCLLESDPSRDIKGALAPKRNGKFAAIVEHREIGQLMRAIRGYDHSQIVRCATLLSAYTFCRPGEIRWAEWGEIHWEEAEWVIPGRKMKGNLDHVVPLSRQAMAILEMMHPATGHTRFVFPSIRTNSRPISDGTVNSALRRMGYTKQQMTAHGFRAMASTRLNEMGFNPDVIERQLAHIERNKVRAAYNRALYLKERRELMQAWADYLDRAAEETIV